MKNMKIGLHLATLWYI